LSDHEDDIKSRAKYLVDLKDLGREIRTISHELNAQTFDSKMLYVDVVEKMIEEQRGALNYSFESDSSIDWSAVANPTKAHLYRVIQEGIQNVHKHAQATKVNVSFKKIDKGIELQLSDNGKGMVTSNAKKGIGLKNMAARVLKINGELSLHSELGEGTTVRVQFR
jgi:signal transduction histidine kinase